MSGEWVAEKREDDVLGKLSLSFLSENFTLSDALEYYFFCCCCCSVIVWAYSIGTTLYVLVMVEENGDVFRQILP